jgi:hypothetical protein
LPKIPVFEPQKKFAISMSASMSNSSKKRTYETISPDCTLEDEVANIIISMTKSGNLDADEASQATFLYGKCLTNDLRLVVRVFCNYELVEDSVAQLNQDLKKYGSRFE